MVAPLELAPTIVADLAEARARTISLLAPLREEELTAQHDPIMSPLVWDLAHIGYFEELWLVRSVGGRPALDERVDELYEAAKQGRADRASLQLLRPAEAHDYLNRVREATLEVLAQGPALPADDPLLRGGYVYRMVLQHEYQHNETMLQTLQLLGGDGYLPWSDARAEERARPVHEEMVVVPAGAFVLGTTDATAAYDNERPAHVVELPTFAIDRFPVTNAAYAEFVEAGGYRRRELWAAEGWEWLRAEAISAPKHWRRDGDRWRTSRFGQDEPVRPHAPVVHVSWFEADAYARWAGKRLPTEAEWEKAASWDPRGRKLVYPWGDEPPTAAHANLDQLAFGPADVGAYPAGASPYGVEQLLGDVWEWTASDFLAYPGFAPFPYDEYSEVFFGAEYKVLRGGSWATRAGAIRTTFRNWDYPIRRQLFAGFRCASDV